MICGDLGSLTPGQRAIVLAKPFLRMRWFASLLNWNGLQLEWIRIPDEGAASSVGVPESIILVDYLTCDREFHIQINELSDHPRMYNATVGPFRYGIGPHVGWYRFELFDDDASAIAEARRLMPFLDRQQFRDPVRRAVWKRAHPELVLKNNRK